MKLLKTSLFIIISIFSLNTTFASLSISPLKFEFNIEQSTDLKELKATDLINIEEIFIKKPKIELNNKQAQLFLNGVKLNTANPDEIYRIYRNEQFLGIGVIKNNLLKRDIIIIDNY